MKGYRDLGVRQLWSALGGGEGCALVDVREYPAWNRARAAGGGGDCCEDGRLTEEG